MLIGSFSVSITEIYSQSHPFPAGRLYILSEGSPGVKGTLAYQDLPCNKLIIFDSIPAYGNQVIVHQNLVFATDGEGAIRIYDIDQNHTKIKTIPETGARSLAIWKDWLLVAANKAPFFYALDMKNSYSKVFGVDTFEIRNEAEAILVKDDIAYVTVNGKNGFGINKSADSTVAVIDLKNQKLIDKITVAKNPNSILSDGDYLYVQSLDYVTGLIITRIGLKDQSILRKVPGAMSLGGFIAIDHKINFLDVDPGTFAVTGINIFDFEKSEITKGIRGPFYSIGYAPYSKHYITSETDFSTTGFIKFIESEGKLKVGISASISPRSFYWLEYPIEFNSFTLGNDLSLCSDTSIKIKAPAGIDKIAKLTWNGKIEGETFIYRNSDPERNIILKTELPNGCVYTDTMLVDLKPYGKLNFDSKNQKEPKWFATRDSVLISLDTKDQILNWNFGERANPNFAIGGNIHKIYYDVGSDMNVKQTISVKLKRGSCEEILTDTIRIGYTGRSHKKSDALEIKVYPNPGTDLVYIQRKSGENLSGIIYEFFDLQGRIILKQTPVNESISQSEGFINTKSLPTGTYILRITTDQGYEGVIWRKE